MRRPVASVFWFGTLGALGLFDFWCARNATVGDSLSECTRAALRTHTWPGRVAFVLAWGGLTAWIVPHILRVVDDNLADLGDYYQEAL